MNQNDPYYEYVMDLYKRYSYFNPKDINKMLDKLYYNELPQEAYYKDEVLEQIYIILSKLTTSIIQDQENAVKIMQTREVVTKNVLQNIAENIAYLTTKMYKLEREYKELKDDYSADIKEDLYNNLDLLNRVKEITEESKELSRAIKIARKEKIDNFLEYYNYYVDCAILENMEVLVNSIDTVLYGGEFGYFGEEFRDKKVFKISSESFLYFYHRLEQTIDALNIKDFKDPKFKEYKETWSIDSMKDPDGKPLFKEDLDKESQQQFDQLILNYADEQCDKYCSFHAYLDLWLPRALAPMGDGNFLVTKTEVDNHINFSGLINLQYEYSVLFDFFKEVGVEVTLDNNVKDFVLYYLQSAGVSEEELNKVYKRDNFDRSNSIRYSEISKEFLDSFVKDNEDIITTTEEMEK